MHGAAGRRGEVGHRAGRALALAGDVHVARAVDGERFEVRAMRGHAPAEFGLYRCTVACELVAALDGGIGTAGEEVRVALPLEALGAAAGAAVSDVRAWTGLGTPPTDTATVDELALSDWVVADQRVELGSAPSDAAAEIVFDTAVNSGPTQAARLLQRIVGVPADGVIGPKTIAAVNDYVVAYGLQELIEAYTEARQNFYRLLPTYVHFGEGWRKRADGVASLAKVLSQPSAV